MTRPEQLSSETLPHDVVAIADNPVDAPTVLGRDAYNAALAEAQRLSAWDATKHKKIITDAAGQPHWAAEYPTVFAFDGQIRGHNELYHRDPSRHTTAQAISGLAGKPQGRFTDVVIETDDGEMVAVRRTGDKISAGLQTFEMMSTAAARQTGERGEALQPRQVHTAMLKGVIAVPGKPLRLGQDPVTKMAPCTRGNVVRITAFDLTPDDIVPVYEKRLGNPDYMTDVGLRFNDALRAAYQDGRSY